MWLLCFSVYILPRLRSMHRFEAHRTIATLHSFRFFGLVFILPGVAGPHLPAGFATFAAYGDFATGVLAIMALLTVRIRPLFWTFVVAFNLVGAGGSLPRLLPRYPDRPSRSGRSVGLYICNPDHLRASSDDHALRGILLADTSSARDRSGSPRQVCRPFGVSIRALFTSTGAICPSRFRHKHNPADRCRAGSPGVSSPSMAWCRPSDRRP